MTLTAEEAAAMAEAGTSTKLTEAETQVNAFLPEVFDKIELAAVSGARKLIINVDTLDEYGITVFNRKLGELGYEVLYPIHQRAHIYW